MTENSDNNQTVMNPICPRRPLPPLSAQDPVVRITTCLSCGYF